MSSLKKKVFVAMSGGVDSSVAAALLKKDGYNVTGVHMLCWEGCENNEDRRDAMTVAAKLGIPFLVWNFKKEYREAVFNYMVREYAAGRTPNPDVMCNKEIKFGVFLKKALEAGADFIATGHYARLRREQPATSNQLLAGSWKLGAARDSAKDQSYFLWTLTQAQLKHCLFPIGDYLKSEVRKIALEAGLPTAEKKESQGLCFVGKVDFQDFLRGILPLVPGEVFSSDGRAIGTHDGAHFYTIGQRHGFALGGQPEPVYIAEKNAATNTLVMAQGQDDPILYRKELVAENLNWIGGITQIFLLARIRYRQPLQRCVAENNSSLGVELKVIFDAPQRAITPGQSIVFYSDSGEMLGGGIIR